MNKENKFVIKRILIKYKIILGGGFLGLINAFLLFLLFGNGFVISDMIKYTFLFIILSAFIGFIISLILKIKIIKKIRKSILLTIGFLLMFFLGLLTIPPFGTDVTLGDFMTSSPTPLVLLSIFPLIIIRFLIPIEISILGVESLLELILKIVVLTIYYYILSELIMYIYRRYKKI